MGDCIARDSLVILSSALACLHIDWGFIRLNVTAADQLSPHRRDHRDQQLADFEDPAVQQQNWTRRLGIQMARARSRWQT
jgi:hypothetical protein